MGNELSDAMVNKHSSFHGNPLLKSSRENVRLTKEHIQELAKCMDDPIYFAEHYVYVVSVDRGKEVIHLYPYQKRMLKALKENRYSIILSCRQSGKCIYYDSMITIRHPKIYDGKPFDMRIGDFYEWQHFKKQYENILTK